MTAHFGVKLSVYFLGFFEYFLHMLDPGEEERGRVSSCFLLYLFWQDGLCQRDHSVTVSLEVETVLSEQ